MSHEYVHADLKQKTLEFIKTIQELTLDDRVWKVRMDVEGSSYTLKVNII